MRKARWPQAPQVQVIQTWVSIIISQRESIPMPHSSIQIAIVRKPGNTLSTPRKILLEKMRKRKKWFLQRSIWLNLWDQCILTKLDLWIKMPKNLIIFKITNESWVSNRSVTSHLRAWAARITIGMIAGMRKERKFWIRDNKWSCQKRSRDQLPSKI